MSFTYIYCHIIHRVTIQGEVWTSCERSDSHREPWGFPEKSYENYGAFLAGILPQVGSTDYRADLVHSMDRRERGNDQIGSLIIIKIVPHLFITASLLLYKFINTHLTLCLVVRELGLSLATYTPEPPSTGGSNLRLQTTLVYYPAQPPVFCPFRPLRDSPGSTVKKVVGPRFTLAGRLIPTTTGVTKPCLDLKAGPEFYLL
jgi:hypothetical protein